MRRRHDFDAIMRAGRPRQHRLFSLRLRPNRLGRVRYGFAVQRRIGGAVVRNRIRRRLREIVRELPPGDGFDLLLVARPPCVQASYDELAAAVCDVVQREFAETAESR